MPLFRKLNMGQTILKYVKEHEKKNGTLTCGGLFFVIPSVIAYFVFFGFGNRLANVAIVIGLAYMVVGFLDDFIKLKTKENLGLRAYQKIIFQTAIAIISGVYAYMNNLGGFYLPFTKIYVDLSYFSIPIVALIFVATTNSVNLTDGLDGLVSWTSLPFFATLAALIFLQVQTFSDTIANQNEFLALSCLSLSLIGGVMGFLVFNTSKAKIFMGDTGSMALGGFISAICVLSMNWLFLLTVGIMFVVSSISVIVQVIYFKKTGKRVFLMSPYHHHLQKKGHTEPQIAYYYFFITVIMGILVLSVYL